MNLRRNIVAAAVTLPVVLGSLIATTAPASAYPSDNCLDSSLCVVFDYNSDLEGRRPTSSATTSRTWPATPSTSTPGTPATASR